ncbi:MAG TPA: hypothetical protein VHG27_02490, partial [Xanthobacteraceae bacterium]|nr:hypothetical protein [Xanthobacteraceae bacterium]
VMAAGNARLVWQVGPQPVVTSDNSTAITKRLPAPRPRPAVALASAGAEMTTASVPWPLGAREDRVPSDLVLAYAALAPETNASVSPMGSLRPPAAAALRQNKPARSAAPRVKATGRLVQNPWLRGIIVARNMHAAMDVTVLGPPNYLALTPLLHKPLSAVANGFADDADFGLSIATFSGEAVAFVPTIGFGRITAGLN